MTFRLLPVKDKIIFESKGSYFDNSKHLYEEMLEYKLDEEYDIYWILREDPTINIPGRVKKIILSNKKNVLSKLINEVKTSYHLNTSKYFFWTYINYSRLVPKKEQFFVNLTHGTPLKDTRGHYSTMDYTTNILALSSFSADLRAKSYLGGREKMLELGFPRNDLLFGTNKSSLLSKLGIETQNYEKIVLWMPTFRRTPGNRNDTGTTEEHDLPILKNQDDIEDFKKSIA